MLGNGKEMLAALDQASSVVSDDELYTLLGLADAGETSLAEARELLSAMSDVEGREALSSTLADFGRRTYARLSRKFKEVVCGPGGPYEQLERGRLANARIQVAVLTAILSHGDVGLMASAYFVVLLLRTGLKTYCEDDDT